MKPLDELGTKRLSVSFDKQLSPLSDRGAGDLLGSSLRRVGGDMQDAGTVVGSNKSDLIGSSCTCESFGGLITPCLARCLLAPVGQFAVTRTPLSTLFSATLLKMLRGPG